MKNDLSTAEAVAWLDSLQASGIRPGLTRMRQLLRALGHPERRCPAIIVAGTNGKGSTSATLASIFNESDLRTGLYTSPHLVDLRERWVIDREMISEPMLERSIQRLREAAARAAIVPTYFEALTLIAFIAFDDAACDVAVLEVGMGGRLDATNVVRPLAAVITPVGFDHTEFLGNTLRKIAREKAGVIHRGSLVLTSNEDQKVLGVIRTRAAKFGIDPIVVQDDHDTPLPGRFQRRNAALAVRTARELRGQFPSITPATIEEGVRRTRWRGRLERVIIDARAFWIDGGHNAHAAAAIIPFIEEQLPSPRLLVFGIMSDKDVDEVISRFAPSFESVITTEPYPPRSMNAETLAAMFRARGVDSMTEPDPERAFTRALATPAASILVAGSLYLAGAAIAFAER